MGLQQSKEELLYQQVNYGNVDGIRNLRAQGAGLEVSHPSQDNKFYSSYYHLFGAVGNPSAHCCAAVVGGKLFVCLVCSGLTRRGRRL
jgi:hypothetical protein